MVIVLENITNKIIIKWLELIHIQIYTHIVFKNNVN